MTCPSPLLPARAQAKADGSKGLPVNIAFVFEGEEENGSIGFREAVTQNLHWFEGTELIIISNTWVARAAHAHASSPSAARQRHVCTHARTHTRGMWWAPCA